MKDLESYLRTKNLTYTTILFGESAESNIKGLNINDQFVFFILVFFDNFIVRKRIVYV